MPGPNTQRILLWARITGLLLLALCLQPLTHAQADRFRIAYGETQSAFLAVQTTHTWTFEAEAREIISVQARRIAGQFAPVLRLIAPDDRVLALARADTYPDLSAIDLPQGLPLSGSYRLEVSGTGLGVAQTENPDEYSLTLRRLGQGRATPNEGLSPLPQVNDAPIPTLASGPLDSGNGLGVVTYGGVQTVQLQSGLWQMQVGRVSLTLDNNNPIQRGIRSITAVAEGAGLLTTNNVPIITTQALTVAYNSNSGLYTLETPNGNSLITDLSRVAAVRVGDNAFAVTMRPDADATATPRILTNAPESRLLRLNAEEHVLRLPNNQYVETDLRGWDTLAYVAGQLRVYYGANGRLLADDVRLDALRVLQTEPLTSEVIFASGGPEATTMQIDWRHMGDVRLQNGVVRVQPLDGREIFDTNLGLQRLLIEDGAVQLQRSNGSYRLSLPDGTDIETPAQIASDPAALPHQAGYIPRGFNNLGRDWVAICSCVTHGLEAGPVNPANGNFHTQVTDFDIPSHTLPLQFIRYYNSQGAQLTPDYMRASPAGYLLGGLGQGWRHSYQFELDITFAPLNRLTLSEPDGTQHLFSAAADNPARFISNTQPTWVIERVGGALGRWQGTTTHGVRYHFDRAGRLTRISESARRAITFSPAPVASADYALPERTGGVFIVEPYGRRLELFTGPTGNIEVARDTSLRQISYSYDENGQRLTNVTYNTPTHGAIYRYEDGLLTGYDDIRSPQPSITIGYDSSRRVNRLIDNPNGGFRRITAYLYEANPRLTRQVTSVNGQTREIGWLYTNDATFGLLLQEQRTPRTGETITYSYTNGTLSNIRQPNLTNFAYEFDARGNLVLYKDPLNPAEADYTLTYAQRGYNSLLTEISYPSLKFNQFSYSDPVPDPGYDLAGYERPLLAEHNQLVLLGVNRREVATRYVYDEWGRVALLIEPGTSDVPQIGTRFLYNAFGYVSEIWQGLPLDDDTTLDDLRSQDALRVLQLEHDLIGQLRAITDGRGNTYTLNWDSNTEKLRTIAGPGGIEIRYVYDDFGRLLRVEDRGQVTEYSYDGLGYLASVTDGNGAVTTYTHDEAGNLLQVVDALLRTFTYTYDELDNLTSATSPGGLVTRYTTALEGGNTGRTIRTQTDPNGRITTHRYDALSRLRQLTIEQNGITQVYNIDYNRRDLPTIIQKENGRTLTIEYDFIGRIINSTVATSTTRYDYDQAGNLISVTSPAGQTTRYAYDTLGNLTQLSLPDGSSSNYTYDENSNLLTQTDPNGLTTTYVYDALNRLTAVEQPVNTNDPERRTSYTYDARGNVQTITDPRRIIRTLRYDSLDQLIAMTDGIGQETTYSHDAIGRLSQIDFQTEGRDLALTYDTEGNISALSEYRDRVRTLYTYDSSGRVTSITNSLGRTTSYRYNAIDQLSRITDAVGNEQRYLWNESTLGLRRYRDPNGRLYSYENTDALGRVLSILDITPAEDIQRDEPPLNTRITYDDDGYVTQLVIAADGAAASQRTQHRWSYDATGRATSYTDPRGNTWQLNYDAGGRLLRVVNPAGNATRYQYNASGDVVRIIHYESTTAERIEQFAYDENGNVARYTAPNGTLNEYTYDGKNRVIEIREAVGTPRERRHIFQYNNLDQLISYQDPEGRVTRYLYTRGNLAQVRRTLADTPIAEFYEYDLADNLINIQLPNNGNDPLEINLTYDALNRRVRYVDSDSNVWAYTYDAVGNVIQISDPLGSTVRYGYDPYDRLSRVTFPDNRDVLLDYDTTGNFRGLTLGATDATLQAPNPPRQSLTYVLDVMGNLNEVRNVGGEATRYTQDALGNVTRRVWPNNAETRYTYDAANRLIEARYTNSGQAITYIYDNAGNPARILGPAATQRLDFSYDAHGFITSTRSQNTAISYTRDLVGNVLLRDAGDLGSTRYTYDSFDRPVRIDYADGLWVELTYNNQGRVTEILRSNNVRTFYAYDSTGRPVLLQHFGPNNERLDRYDYRYDSVGNLTRIDRVAGQERSSVLFTYDVAHRLLSERWLNERGEALYTLEIRYDDAGNRAEVAVNGQRTLYLFNNRNQISGQVNNYTPRDTDTLQLPGFSVLALLGVLFFGMRRRYRLHLLMPCLLLLSFGVVLAQNNVLTDVRYEYDINGNLSRMIYGRVGTPNPLILNFSYDEEQRLVAVNGADAAGRPVATTFNYDAMSRINLWQVGNAANALSYDGRTPIAMQNVDGITRYLHLNAERLLTILPTGDVRWHLNDQFHSTRLFTDAAGNLLRDDDLQRDFNGFGERIFPQGTPDDSTLPSPTYLFNNQLYDPASGLYLLGLRAYNPSLGRFLQPDPIQPDLVGNVYTYARNRPLTFYDASGMTVQPVLEPPTVTRFAQVPQPRAFIPQPQLPDLPTPPPVHHLQRDDNFRSFTVSDAIYGQANGVVGRIAPLLDDFYLLGINPMPQSLRQLAAQTLQQTMAIYETGVGWLPDVTPDAFAAPNPFALVDEVAGLVAHAQTDALQWHNAYGVNREPLTLLPELVLPAAISAQMQGEQTLQDAIIPLQPAAGLASDYATLLPLPADPPQPVQALPEVQQPSPMIEPAIASAVDALRQQQARFTQRIYNLGVWPCALCDAYLTIGAGG